MEVIVKPTMNNLDSYIKSNVNNFLLPLKNYSVGYTNYYDLEAIKKIRNNYSNINIFISINKNIFNEDILKLKDILLELDTINIKGIFFYDLAILNLKKELGIKIDLVWNQTHMVTNYKTCNYYYSKGVKYALLAKEITKEEIIDIKNNSKIMPIVELISYPTIAFSRRKLVNNYYKNYNLKEYNTLNIVEPKTKQEYVLIEDNNGVNFVMKKLMNGSRILKDLKENNIGYILLKEDMIEHNTFLKVLGNINYYLNNYKEMTDIDYNNWINKQNELLGRNTNFFFRKTIYKVKK